MEQNSDILKIQEKSKRRREVIIIFVVVAAIVVVTWLESHISAISGDIPVATNILILGLININIILLILLIFLILRNAVKLFFESKRKVIGSKLRVKLVASFIGLSIVPSLLLFVIAIGLINKSIDGWFDIKIEDSLKESLDVAQNYYKDTIDRVQRGSWMISEGVLHEEMLRPGPKLHGFLSLKLKEHDYSSIEVYNIMEERVGYVLSSKVNKNMVPDLDAEDVKKALVEEARSYVVTHDISDVVRGVAPIVTKSIEGESIVGAVIVSYYVPRSLVAKMKEISATFEGVQQQKLIKNPVKATYFTILLIITLLIIFFSIWIGQQLAKEITVPITELAEGTHAIASGNLDYKINIRRKDEIGLLVNSFNRMTDDLRSGKERVEHANLELRASNLELDRRRRYIEIILGNIPAGVISIDKVGEITSFNRIAAEMLGSSETEALGKNYRDVLRPKERDTLRDMIKEMAELKTDFLDKQMKVELEDRVISVLVNLTAIEDEKGDYVGMVAVLDDLTNLLKTQRMVAWKEVARRIAHEVKNPLTPIQLSAQRLRKKYLEKFSSKDGAVFDECTSTIIGQVEELKNLVNEFSAFARMPAAEPTPNNLNELVGEILAFYRSGHKGFEFIADLDDDMPVLEIDKEQIKRVLINLVDNAIAAMGDERGRVEITTRFDTEHQIAKLEVADTGSGIPPEDKPRLFEPYFSTKTAGTGLGLSIVSNIIADHNGYIRIKDNEPKGTRFLIELPIKTITI